MSEHLDFYKAIISFHKKMKNPKKDRFNTFFKSPANPKGYPYSSLDAIYDCIRHDLAECGLFVSHSVVENTLHTKLVHVSGQSVENTVPIFRIKDDPQGFASALTYARRQAISCLLCISADEDDDGNAASGNLEKAPEKKEPPKKDTQKPAGKETISVADACEIEKRLKPFGSKRDEVLAFFAKAEGIADAKEFTQIPLSRLAALLKTCSNLETSHG